MGKRTGGIGKPVKRSRGTEHTQHTQVQTVGHLNPYSNKHGKNNMRNLKEKDLRKLFKKLFKKSIVFVEHGSGTAVGGTTGISDCILFIPNGDDYFESSCTVFIELKRDKHSTIRKSQKRFMGKVIRQDQFIVVAYWDRPDVNSRIRLLRVGSNRNKTRLRYTHTITCNPTYHSLKEALSEILSVQETVH